MRYLADVLDIVERCWQTGALTEADVTRLFNVRGADFSYVVAQADQLREKVNGDTVSYVVNRNINYTNVCYFKCQFCAFSKGKQSENLRGRPYDITGEDIAGRCSEAWDRGATEVCMQGGIHPDYTGQTYLDIVNTVRSATPEMHIHAFSPLEVWQGAATLGVSVPAFLRQLRQAGLNTLPGTAAEILHDEVRANLCPDKLNTEQWLEVMAASHAEGCALRQRLCTVISIARGIGRAICCISGRCNSVPPALLSLCLCRSCIWKHQCISRVKRDVGPAFAKRFLCTPWLGWCFTGLSRTFRPRG